MKIQLPSLRRFVASLLCGSLWFVLLLPVGVVAAQGDSSIGQAFQTDDSGVVTGALVSLQDGAPNAVELATSEDLDQLLGVVGSQPLIELSTGASTIQVVTNGRAATLVSDINGSIKTGDKITASPVAGVGMKATSSGLILGTAQADLNTETAETRTIKNKNGKEQTIHIAAIQVQVDKVYYEPPSIATSFVPPVFENLAESVAGKQVSPVRIMVAGLLVILLFGAVVSLLYSAARSGIISIGRNPLSEKAVHKSLWQVWLTVTAVFFLTLAAIYFILTV